MSCNKNIPNFSGRCINCERVGIILLREGLYCQKCGDGIINRILDNHERLNIKRKNIEENDVVVYNIIRN